MKKLLMLALFFFCWHSYGFVLKSWFMSALAVVSFQSLFDFQHPSKMQRTPEQLPH